MGYLDTVQKIIIGSKFTYQWGRKDPFTPAMTPGYGTEVQIYNADGIAITKGPNGVGTTDEHEFKYEIRTTTNQTTINHLIQNPSTHYAKGDGANSVPIASAEYYKNTKEGDWWNPTIKTIYDPCPNGYRIPKSGTYGEASEWTKSDPYSGLISGYIWDNTLSASFFTASGLRSSYNGQFSVVGTNGYYSTSTPSGFFGGGDLKFIPDSVYPLNGDYRAYSLPTRCIKE